ncbi:hypothetical protein [Streptosporangium amethystogenes]|uniref:hypothetical protein n=1 Tax=Streptosporangium amethystogenes TaxID=2002 RepID=UPI001B80237E|nr:hypothetical protein [Streptosporangium amethystogenes]
MKNHIDHRAGEGGLQSRSSVPGGAQPVQGAVEEAFGLLALFGFSRGEGDAGEAGEHVGRAEGVGIDA